eukprot:438436_1
MAAILCRVCFVEPCKAMAKCCEGCCDCLGSCCECFGKCIGACCESFVNCCDFISSCCDKPFSGCLFTSVIINLIALIYGVIAIISGGNQCDKPLLILGIILLVCAIINALFSYYMYYTVNNDTNNPLFNQQNATEMKASAKLYAFFKYDKWMAVYIIFIICLIALLIVCITMAGSCASQIGYGVFWVSIIIFIYLGVAMLILFSYVAFDAFKEWAGCCPCWLIPICWPCLIVGCCLNLADDMNKSINPNKNNNNTNNNYKSNDYKPPPENQTQTIQSPQATQPVIVVQQPPPQQVIYTQPQQVVYTQPQQPIPQQVVVTQPVTIQQTQPQQPQQGYNPNTNVPIQPGVLYANNNDNTNTNVSQQQEEEIPGNNDDNKENEVDYDQVKEKAKQTAKAAGKHAKKAGVKALGWMTKKMNEINEKVQDKGDDNNAADAAPNEGQEGNDVNQKTY